MNKSLYEMARAGITAKVELTNELINIKVMQHMGWSYNQLMETPIEYIYIILNLIKE